MIPFGTHNVTLFHRNLNKVDGKTKVRYDKHILLGCSWRQVDKTENDNGAFVTEQEIICKVPNSQYKPEIGDIIVKGEYLDAVNSSSDFEGILSANSGAFKVQSVTDNSAEGILPHFVCKGR